KQKHLDAIEKAVHKPHGQDTLRRDLEAAFALLERDVARLRDLTPTRDATTFPEQPDALLERDVARLRDLASTRDATTFPEQPDRNVVASLVGARSIIPSVAAIAAWGERLSVLLVAASAADMGLKAVPVREEIIITGHLNSEIPQPLGAAIGADPLPDETRINAQTIPAPLIEQQEL